MRGWRVGIELDLQVRLVRCQDRQPRAQYRAGAQCDCRVAHPAAPRGARVGVGDISYKGEELHGGDNDRTSGTTLKTSPFPVTKNQKPLLLTSFTHECLFNLRQHHPYNPRSSRSCISRAGASGKRGEILHSKGTGRLQNRPKSVSIHVGVCNNSTDMAIP